MCVSNNMLIIIIVNSKIGMKIPISKLRVFHQINKILILHSINIVYALNQFVDAQIKELCFLPNVLYGISACLFYINRRVVLFLDNPSLHSRTKQYRESFAFEHHWLNWESISATNQSPFL